MSDANCGSSIKTVTEISPEISSLTPINSSSCKIASSIFLSSSLVEELPDGNNFLNSDNGEKKEGLSISQNEIRFIITDFKNEIIVSYRGAVPALFAEGKGVVAEGKLQDKKFFLAKRILAKHDENYMPPEIKESLSDHAK